jgi:hypothetical protein
MEPWIIEVLVSQISKDQLPLSSSGGLSDMPERVLRRGNQARRRSISRIIPV